MEKSAAPAITHRRGPASTSSSGNRSGIHGRYGTSHVHRISSGPKTAAIEARRAHTRADAATRSTAADHARSCHAGASSARANRSADRPLDDVNRGGCEPDRDGERFGAQNDDAYVAPGDRVRSAVVITAGVVFRARPCNAPNRPSTSTARAIVRWARAPERALAERTQAET